MSMFAVGGLSGWALGPILTTPIVAVFGLRGTAIVACVPLAASLLLTTNLRYFEGFRPSAEAAHVARASAAPSDWTGFTVTAAAGMLRTGALFGFQAFIPLYVWRTLDSSEGVGNTAIAAMLAAGAVGTLLGGRLSDLHGFRRVVVCSLFASVPLALLVPVVPLLALFPVLILFGLISEMNFYPIVVLAQRALPQHVGFASGVTLGLSIGLGSLASPLLGLLADSTSLRSALVGAGVLTLLAAVVSLAIPRHET
jgi:FSR family fosmidomycin resistance protein-like MFS transporter